MRAIYKLLSTLLICGIGTLILIVPSVSIETWMNETQSGKTFIFIFGIIGIAVISLIRIIFLRNYRGLTLSFLDVLLFGWIIYIFANGIFHSIPFSLRIIDLAGLIIFYLVLRQIEQKYYPILFLVLMLGGFFQVIYGNLQLWGYFPSHHGLFKMTGSFFNPGPYAGYLAGIFPVALGFYLFKFRILTAGQEKILYHWISQLSRKAIRYFPKHVSYFKEPLTEKHFQKPTQHYYAGMLYIAIITAILLVIPASRSRASWIAIIASSGFLFIAKYRFLLQDLFFRILNTVLKKTICIVFVILFASGGAWGLYHFKKGSADGRMLIWKVSSGIIKDNPITGVGFDRFKSHYMDYQAEYFRQNPESEEAMVAGDTNYAFNEFLQQTVENGIIGLLFILFILTVAFSKIFSKGGNCYQKESNESPNTIIYTNGHEEENNSKHIILIAKAGIISILVFGLFSYPAQILPIKMSFVLFLVTVAGRQPFIVKQRIKIALQRRNNLMFGFAKIALSVCVLVTGVWTIKKLTAYTNAYKSWNSAHRLYQVGAYDACLEDYDKAYPVLKTNGDFLTNYGKALCMAEKHPDAINILQQAGEYYPNIVVYTALGDSYKNIHEMEKAEKSYFHAWYMNPSKFYPKYLLAKLYDETGQAEKAIFMAKELMVKEIKIESTAIQEIRDEMQKIIEKGEE